MAVPTQTDLHRPILEILAEHGDQVSIEQIIEPLVRSFSLTESDQREMNPSGRVTRLRANIGWALFWLKRAGLAESPSRGKHSITLLGWEFLQSTTGVITLRRLTDLAQLEEDYVRANPTTGSSQEITPEQHLERSHALLHRKLREDIAESVVRISASRFEQLVVDLLVAMGYGQGEAVGRSGDGGIHGIINQDALGLEKVYLQAKRWSNQVGEPEIRNFSGSLDAQGASKGVFITASTFSQTARQTAQTISSGSKTIRLIDGQELAQLMIRHGVGVVTEYTYEIKKLDENYFADDI